MPRSKSSISNNPSASARAAEPVAETELDAIFAIFAGQRKIALAVSGGPDSLALLHLALAWRGRLTAGRPGFLVLTVDHSLRPEAATEAAKVAADAIALGVEARVLTRPKPGSAVALQEGARADRYRLLAEAATEAGAGAIATAHTLDDQAETLLMRLARGSGVDGLSAMAPAGRLGDLALLRPFLGLSKARLEASLAARGITWAVDPSNANLAFERPRLRALRAALEQTGLTAEAIATSARRLARARAALEATTTEAASRLVTIHDEGYFEVDRRGYDALPQEISLRLLGRLIARLGTPGQPERLARLERLADQLATGAVNAASLAGCLVKVGPDRIQVLREPGREGLPRLSLDPGQSILWDNRCRVTLSPRAAAPVVIRALETADFHGELAAAARAAGLQRAVLLASPSAWRDGALLAMPVLGFVSAELNFSSCLSLSPTTAIDTNDVLAPTSP